MTSHTAVTCDAETEYRASTRKFAEIGNHFRQHAEATPGPRHPTADRAVIACGYWIRVWAGSDSRTEVRKRRPSVNRDFDNRAITGPLQFVCVPEREHAVDRDNENSSQQIVVFYIRPVTAKERVT